MQELHRRGTLRSALAGRDEKQINLLLTFVARYYFNLSSLWLFWDLYFVISSATVSQKSTDTLEISHAFEVWDFTPRTELVYLLAPKNFACCMREYILHCQIFYPCPVIFCLFDEAHVFMYLRLFSVLQPPLPSWEEEGKYLTALFWFTSLTAILCHLLTKEMLSMCLYEKGAWWWEECSWQKTVKLRCLLFLQTCHWA